MAEAGPRRIARFWVSHRASHSANSSRLAPGRLIRFVLSRTNAASRGKQRDRTPKRRGSTTDLAPLSGLIHYPLRHFLAIIAPFSCHRAISAPFPRHFIAMDRPVKKEWLEQSPGAVMRAQALTGSHACPGWRVIGTSPNYSTFPSTS